MPEVRPLPDQSAVTMPLALPERSRSLEIAGTTVTCCIPAYSCTLAGATVLSPAELSNVGVRSGSHNAQDPTAIQAAVTAASRVQVTAVHFERLPPVLCFIPNRRIILTYTHSLTTNKHHQRTHHHDSLGITYLLTTTVPYRRSHIPRCSRSTQGNCALAGSACQTKYCHPFRKTPC